MICVCLFFRMLPLPPRGVYTTLCRSQISDRRVGLAFGTVEKTMEYSATLLIFGTVWYIRRVCIPSHRRVTLWLVLGRRHFVNWIWLPNGSLELLLYGYKMCRCFEWRFDLTGMRVVGWMDNKMCRCDYEWRLNLTWMLVVGIVLGWIIKCADVALNDGLI